MKPYQFALGPNESQYYTVTSSGSVVIVDAYTPIAHACMNWKDFKVTYQRNTTLGGVFREYTNSLNFTKAAQKILRYVFYTQGIEGQCLLKIRQINTGGLSYDPFVSSNLDFSNCADERDFFTINIMDRGLAEALNSNIDVTQQISLSDPDAITILNDGARLGATARWVLGEQSPDPIGIDGVYHGYGYGIPTANSADIQAGYFFIPRDAALLFASNILVTPPASFSGNMTNVDWYNLNYSGVLGMFFQWSVNSGTASQMKVEVYATFLTPTVTNLIKIGESPTVGVGTYNFSIPLSGFIQHVSVANPKALVFMIRFVVVAGSTSSNLGITTQFNEDITAIQIDYLSNLPATTCKAFRYKDFASKMIQKIGGDGILSNYLSNPNGDRFTNWDMNPYNVTVTSGDGVRNAPDADIKSTPQDMIHDAFSQFVIWSEVEGNSLRMEPIPYFLQNTVIANITSIKNFKIIPNTTYIFNDILVGYDSQDTQNVSGKNEFNTLTEFLIDGVKRVAKQDDAKTSYIAGVYAIEQGRADTYNQNQKDNKFDTDVMLIEINPTPIGGQYSPFRGVGAVITGVDDPTGIYNVYLSPKRKLLRHLPRIKSMCQTGVAKFQSTDKNPDLVSTFVSGTIIETADVPLDQDTLNFGTINSHNVKRWMQAGIYYEIECPSSTKLYNAVKNNPRGLISFEDKGNIYRGWILESTFTTSTKEGNTLKLIPHPDDILTNRLNG